MLDRLRSGGPGPSAESPLPGGLLLELAREGAAPLEPARGAGEPASVAAVVPSFRRGSGGHATIVSLLRALGDAGHEVSLWLEDSEGRHAREDAARTQRAFAEFFAGAGLALHTDFASWQGADVVLATGWQTVPRALLLRGARARAYLVQDHEPDFYPASAESLWAAWTYRQGLPCVAASAWLAQLLRERYGASATHFELAVDHELYRPGEPRRRDDVVAFYARASTPRRAVPLGLAALEALAARRPATEIVLYGETAPPHATQRQLGILEGARLAELYRSATVGLVLSLTNPSLVGLEMMACGLPCVELASESMLASFGHDGPLRLAEPDPLSLCEAIEELLASPAERDRRSKAGIALMAERSWGRAAEQLSDALTAVLRRSG